MDKYHDSGNAKTLSVTMPKHTGMVTDHACRQLFAIGSLVALCVHDGRNEIRAALHFDRFMSARQIQQYAIQATGAKQAYVETPTNPYELWFRICWMNHGPMVYVRKDGRVTTGEKLLPKAVRDMGCFFMYVEAAHTHHTLFRKLGVVLPTVKDIYADSHEADSESGGESG